MTKEQIKNAEVELNTIGARLSEDEKAALVAAALEEQQETKESFMTKAKGFVKKHKVVIGATIGGVALGAFAATKLSKDEEFEEAPELEMSYNEQEDLFEFDKEYKSEEEEA